MTATKAKRIATLDVVRGVAVMGILACQSARLRAARTPAYFSPLAWGGTSTSDLAAWFVTFVLIDGKMRGLFSFLFGASMLLIVDRARTSGQSAAAVHFPRMAVLFLIGVAPPLPHLVGRHIGALCAWSAWSPGSSPGLARRAAARLGPRLPRSVLFLRAWRLSGAARRARRAIPRRAIATWIDFARGFGVPPSAELDAEIARDARRLDRQCPLALGSRDRPVQLPQIRRDADAERDAARHGRVSLGPADRRMGPRPIASVGPRYASASGSPAMPRSDF